MTINVKIEKIYGQWGLTQNILQLIKIKVEAASHEDVL